MQIILLNGPSGVGKTELAKTLKEKYPTYVVHESFARVLYRLVTALTDISIPSLHRLKHTNEIIFDNCTTRTILARTGDAIRETYGNNVFLELLCKRVTRIKEDYRLISHVIVDDVGFEFEIDYIKEKFGKENVTVYRVVREDLDFQPDDNRGWTSYDKLLDNYDKLDSVSLRFAREIGLCD